MTELYRYSVDSLMEERSAMGGTLAQLCENTMKRVRRTGYLEFGPYWWAVKRILSANGYSLGPADDPLMVERFSVKHPSGEALTLLAAWKAADEIRGTFFKGSREIPLDDMGDESYSLFDPDMEGGQ